MTATVRIAKKPDGTNGAIIVVEELMHTIFDDLVKDGKVQEGARADYLAHADHFVLGPSGSLIERETGADLHAYTQDLLKIRPHWAPPVIADEELEVFGGGPNVTLAKRGAYLKKHGEEKYPA